MLSNIQSYVNNRLSTIDRNTTSHSIKITTDANLVILLSNSSQYLYIFYGFPLLIS